MTQKLSNIAILVFGFFLILPLVVFAQEGGFVEIVGLPWIEPDAVSINEYVNGLLRIAIIAAALTTVIKLILAGAQYILSDVVTNKESAKKDIRGALVGLLIILIAIVILRTINPELVNLSALPNASINPVSTPQQNQPTACQIDPDSEACCTEQNGDYICIPYVVIPGSTCGCTGEQSDEEQVEDDADEGDYQSVIKVYGIPTEIGTDALAQIEGWRVECEDTLGGFLTTDDEDGHICVQLNQ